MKQMRLIESGFERKAKRTHKREFLDEMNLVVPWAEPVALIAPHAPARATKGGRPPFPVQTMLRIHFLQWFNLSDPAMEEALYDSISTRFGGCCADHPLAIDSQTIASGASCWPHIDAQLGKRGRNHRERARRRRAIQPGIFEAASCSCERSQVTR